MEQVHADDLARLKAAHMEELEALRQRRGEARQLDALTTQLEVGGAIAAALYAVILTAMKTNETLSARGRGAGGRAMDQRFRDVRCCFFQTFPFCP